MKNVPRQALGMHAYQRESRRHITHDKGDRFFDAAIAVLALLGAKAVNTEFSPPGGKLRGGHLLNLSGHSLIIAAVQEAICQRICRDSRSSANRGSRRTPMDHFYFSGLYFASQAAISRKTS